LTRGKFGMPNNQLPSDYDPLDDPNYMSLKMLQYFENILNKMLDDICNKEHSISLSLMDNPTKEADHVDQGSQEEQHYNDFMYQEHEEHMRQEVEYALRRISNYTYGYCEETKEPIGVKRLLIAPQARYCMEMQKEREKKEKMKRHMDHT
jgi:DnaK suppressor protein